MQHKSKAQVVALFLALTASLLVINRLSAADRPADAAAKQNTPPKTPSLNDNSYVPTSHTTTLQTRLFARRCDYWTT